MDLGNNLRFYRNNKNYTQEEVARLMNLDRSAISQYENGLRVPPIETLSKFASIYEVTVDALIGYGEYKRIGEVSRLLINMSDNEMELTIKLLEACLKVIAEDNKKYR